MTALSRTEAEYRVQVRLDTTKIEAHDITKTEVHSFHYTRWYFNKNDDNFQLKVQYYWLILDLNSYFNIQGFFINDIWYIPRLLANLVLSKTQIRDTKNITLNDKHIYPSLWI